MPCRAPDPRRMSTPDSMILIELERTPIADKASAVERDLATYRGSGTRAAWSDARRFGTCSLGPVRTGRPIGPSAPDEAGTPRVDGATEVRKGQAVLDVNDDVGMAKPPYTDRGSRRCCESVPPASTTSKGCPNARGSQPRSVTPWLRACSPLRTPSRGLLLHRWADEGDRANSRPRASGAR